LAPAEQGAKVVSGVRLELARPEFGSQQADGCLLRILRNRWTADLRISVVVGDVLGRLVVRGGFGVGLADIGAAG
jgi:hypothetical protein